MGCSGGRGGLLPRALARGAMALRQLPDVPRLAQRAVRHPRAPLLRERRQLLPAAADPRPEPVRPAGRAGGRPGRGGRLLAPGPGLRRLDAPRTAMGRLRVLLAAALLLPAAASAHIGSPDVVLEGAAGPYGVLVRVRPPDVVPGTAEVTLRVTHGDPTRV